MQQVAEEFTKKKNELKSAKRAAEQLKVPLSCFYKYLKGEDLPGVEVLKRAQDIWKIKWDLVDPSEMLRRKTPVSAEQLLLPLIRSVREEDVEIIEVAAGRDSCLRVMIKIRFPVEVQK
jgi:hypothetical protein